MTPNPALERAPTGLFGPRAAEDKMRPMPIQLDHLIVPSKDRVVDCRVMWEGKPEPHAMVKVWSLVGNRIFLQNIYTENDGTIRFPISSYGPWMVSSVKMIPSEKEGADYQSLWASIVFEIKAP